MALMLEYRSVNVSPPPTRTLMVRIRFEWSDESVLVRDARATLVMANQQGQFRVSHPMLLSGYPRHITQDQSRWEETLEFPLSNEAIVAIQKHRRDDVRMGVEVRYSPVQIRGTPSNSAIPLSALSGSSTQMTDVYFEIAQSEWAKLLGKLDWDQVDFIEVSRSALVQVPELTDAFERLRTAQTAFWRGDYRQVAIDCRAALESAFKHFGGNDVKAGAGVVWNLIFPGDPKRQELIDGFVLSLTKYLHEFRHEQAPAAYLGRSEAELFLSTTSLVFSLASRRLAKLEA